MKIVFRTVALAFLLAGVFLIWLYWPGLMPIESKVLSERGLFGDSYGSLNTLFTGWAFAAVLFTLYLQHSDANKREIERHEDTVESRFFEILGSLRNLTLAVHVGGAHDGKSSFRALEKKVNQEIHNSLSGDDGDTAANLEDDEEFVKIVLEAYMEIHRSYRTQLGPYFRTLYQVLGVIERAPADRRSDYIHLLRAELSEAEITLLALHGLAVNHPPLENLINRYGLLAFFRAPSSNIPRWLFERRYCKCAFEENGATESNGKGVFRFFSKTTPSV